MRLLLSLLCIAFVACTPPATSDVARDVERVTGGNTSSGHPNILVVTGSGGACSGTLIGRRTLLTAAHCLANIDAPPPSIDPSTITVRRVGSAASLDVASADIHPTPDPTDLAVVVLDEIVHAVVPAALAETTPVIGEAITVAGLGTTDTGDPFGTLRAGPNYVSSVFGWGFGFDTLAGAAPCVGDSGGPSFVNRGGDEQLLGVHSRSEDDDCSLTGGTATDIRVDPELAWIASVAGDDLYDGSPIDVTAPTVTIVAPANAAMLGGPFSVTVEAVDNVAVVRVDLFLDDELARSASQSPFAFALDALSSGDHLLRATAVDAEFNEASNEIAISGPAADNGDCDGDGGTCGSVPTPTGDGCGSDAACADAPGGCAIRRASTQAAQDVALSLLPALIALGTLFVRTSRRG